MLAITRKSKSVLDSVNAKLAAITVKNIAGHGGDAAVHMAIDAGAVFRAYKTVCETFSVKRDFHPNAIEEAGSFLETGFSAFSASSRQTVFDAMVGKLDIGIFRDEKERLSKSLKIDFLDSFVNRRRARCLSEHDGELDFDRLYEIQPFSSTRFENNGVLRTIDLDIHISFSSGVSARSIARYGALAWGLVDLIERAGIQVNLNLVKSTDLSNCATSIDASAEHHAPNFLIQTINVKKAGEYMDSFSLARCFTPFFYRRCLFNTTALVQQARGRDSAYGLGRPRCAASSAEYGRIVLSPENFLGQEPDFQLVTSFLKTALGVDRK